LAYAFLTEGASGVITTGKGVAEVGLTLVGAALRVRFAAVLALRALGFLAGLAGDLRAGVAVGMQVIMHLTLSFYKQGVDKWINRYTC
tara:strand:- start:2153 stop:2416 length:264 start_codon:yes stop_codon:yes gene_type:complete